MVPAKLQPALLAGVAIGVLSALPVVNIVNLCCCAWVVAGGALAAHLMQQNHPAPINAGDGAIVGLLAGAIGAVFGTVLSIPIAMMMGPFQVQMMERVLQGAEDMPAEVRSIFEQLQGGMGGAALGIGFIFSLFFSLFFYSVFGLFGGLLGALMFRKDAPPPAPPSPGFEPPTFNPPPPLPPAS
ncbi:MAG TPA: hypothetical protein VMO26_05550 [Vicinamibacterales bacterium]|nr:hypothetical protein [Vicinamibacterales bacterium]